MLQIGHPCGLCNRLDVITTGYVLARMQGDEEVEVQWPLNWHLSVSFYDLFTHLPFGRVVDGTLDPKVHADYMTTIAGLSRDYRDEPIYGETLRRLLDCAVPAVRSEVTEFMQSHFHAAPGRGPFGVHIRRVEKPLPFCNFAQPLRYYEAAMKSFPKDERFFVSTDSQEAFSWLLARFGDRVFQRPKQHDNRSDVSGVREGLVDMLLLSSCRGIIGTYGSSFSGIAALAGSNSILMVKAIPQVPAEWPHFSIRRWLWSYRHFVRESTFWRRELDWTVRPQAARLWRAPARIRRVLQRRFGPRTSGHTRRR